MFCFSLFISFISSIFIPYEATETGKIGFLTKDTFNEVYNFERFMLLVIDENAREADIYKTSFAVASTTVSRNCEFAYVSSMDVPEITQNVSLSAPFGIYFNKGEQICVFDIPIEESLVIAQVNFLLNSPQVVQSYSELNSYISNLDYTIISRVKLSDDAYNLMIENMEDMTTCGILLASNEVFSEMGFEKENFLLFRRDDTAILPFNGTSEGIIDIIIPMYFQATFEDIINDVGVDVVFFTPQYKESDTFHDVFFNLAQKYKGEFNFRILTEENFILSDILLGRDLTTIPATAVADPYLQYYFDTHEFDGLEINKEWEEKMTSFLDRIKINEVKVLNLSEPIPTHEEPDQITKIVGNTFLDFINDTQRDVFVMFGSRETYNGLDVLFNNIIDELNMPDKVKFGKIDVFRNKCNYEYVYKMPQLALYKKGENLEPITFLGMNDEKHYKLFIKENTGIDVEVENLTEQECLFDKFYIKTQYVNAKKLHNHVQSYLQHLEQICPSNDEDNNATLEDSTNEL